MSGAAIVVRCADASTSVWATLRSAERQTLRPEIALVADASTPASTRAWLRAVAESRHHQFVEAAGDRPAAVKNAGIRATIAPVVACIDAGCELHATFLAETMPHLPHDATAAASSWIEWAGPGPGTVVDELPPVSLAGCLANSEALSGTAVLRRQDWLDEGGYDESLPSLEDLDLWLRLLARG